MVQSISASGTAPVSASGSPSATSLQAQLQRYQQQLSDCVNCDSAKTPEGKAAIQAIAAKVSQVEQKIGALQNSKQSLQPPAVATSSPAGSVSGVSAPASATDHTGLGFTINVYA